MSEYSHFKMEYKQVDYIFHCVISIRFIRLTEL